jgi:hypothetical protein
MQCPSSFLSKRSKEISLFCVLQQGFDALEFGDLEPQQSKRSFGFTI